MKKIKKVLLLGSGALKIGEAGEFDYSGSQCLKALREEGIKTVLVNPNIATIQTSELLADKVYLLPVTVDFVAQVIAKEKPDAIILSFGGQTALNCGVALWKNGVLKKHEVQVLGTSIPSIILTEDRQKFADHLRGINIPIPESGSATTLEQAKKLGYMIGFPLMVRAAFTLGGQKSGVAWNHKELASIVSGALAIAPQVLIEKYLRHYKEIEYEVIRDSAGNCVTVCNMENMDPLGIHTGESIVVAPSQTLNDFEYHHLRQTSIQIANSLGIIGECNVQYALNPHPNKGRLEYYVIEVNARLSRSSALASKATGYPLAYVAAKLIMGKTLDKVPNQITKITQSFFEPALDYVVVKIPRWDLEKFHSAEEKLGSAMKSVGEVMGIGRTFEEALQKATRMLKGGMTNLTENGFAGTKEMLDKYIATPTPKRLYALAEAMRRGVGIKKLQKLSGIDPWFLSRIKSIVQAEEELIQSQDLSEYSLRNLKGLGFSDARIGAICDTSEQDIRARRKSFGITPSVFQIDTLAGEFPAQTNYLYLTYNGSHNDVSALGTSSVIVLGSGPYHIGSSVEFDWSCVHTALALKKYGKKSIIINCNPETVSTDYDMSDRLYFEDVSFEVVADIYDFENSGGVVISVGGQTPNNLAGRLFAYQVPILGTSPADIDRAEDRNKFSELLDQISVRQPPWQSFIDPSSAKDFSDRVGYPVLVRPSYVLSGSAMSVCFDSAQLEAYVNKATSINRKHPVTISKFITGAKEIEVDAVASSGQVQIYAIAEHVENAGVHSGDATIVYPPQKVYTQTAYEIEKITKKLASALRVTGPFNIQFLVKENKVQVIEVNLRASRSLPFISKATGINFAEVAVASFYKKSKLIAISHPDYCVVKSPQFSFSRLTGVDPVLRVEMSSTGEVACFGDDFEEALLKSIYASHSFGEEKTVLLSLGGAVNKKRFLDSMRVLFQKGYQIYATASTHDFLVEHSIRSELVYKLYEHKKPNVSDLILEKKVGFVVNLSEYDKKREKHFQEHLTDGYFIRRATVDANTPLFTDLQLARSFVRALSIYSRDQLKIKSLDEYVHAHST